MLLEVRKRISGHGTSKDLVECVCGELVWCYTWSVAGSGKYCPNCGRLILYSKMQGYRTSSLREPPSTTRGK